MREASHPFRGRGTRWPRSVHRMALPTWEEIDALTPEQVAEKFNRGVENVVPGVQFWADILVYKATMRAADEQAQQNAAMVRLTMSIERLTRRLWWVGLGSLAASAAAVVIAVGS